MTEPTDPLESELRAFRPVEVSPALRRGLAGHLAARRRRLRWISLAGGLAAAAAAVVATVLVPWGSGAGRTPRTTRPATPAPASASAPDGDAMPSLHAYRRALARSPENLDALLARHAGLGLGRGREIVRVRDLRRPASDGQTFSGEL